MGRFAAGWTASACSRDAGRRRLVCGAACRPDRCDSGVHRSRARRRAGTRRVVQPRGRRDDRAANRGVVRRDRTGDGHRPCGAHARQCTAADATRVPAGCARRRAVPDSRDGRRIACRGVRRICPSSRGGPVAHELLAVAVGLPAAVGGRPRLLRGRHRRDHGARPAPATGVARAGDARLCRALCDLYAGVARLHRTAFQRVHAVARRSASPPTACTSRTRRARA